jgi:hypothetical protein
MAASRRGSGQQPLFGAAIPLPKPVKLDQDTMMGGLREVVGQAGARVRLIDDDSGRRGLLAGLRARPAGITCEIAGVRLSVTASPRPLCDAAAMHSFINPAVWRGSVAGLKAHRAHLLIAEEDGNPGSGADAMFDRATAVTLAAAAVASMIEAEGVIWLPARNTLPIGAFGTEMERFIDGQAPLQFWVRCQVLPAPVQAEHEFGQLSGPVLHPGVATIGLAAFIGAEIIAPPSDCPRDVMLDHILGLASAVIDENAPLTDGGVYGQAGGHMVRLTMRRASQYSERPYWELQPRAAPEPKPEAPRKAQAEEAGPGFSPPRLRLVVPGR